MKNVHLLSSKHILPYSDTSNEPKQETLEEAVQRLIKLNRQDGFYEGAKWQAERMYSEEEVLNLWNWLNDGFIIRKSLPTRDELIGWFEQFKNK